MDEAVRRMVKLPARASRSAGFGAIAGCLPILIPMPVNFAFFPVGLVLYWAANILLSIAQRCNINRRIEAQAKTARAVG
jgi:membrane protein insertase Oxa1/YidC/SpoIIIJ